MRPRPRVHHRARYGRHVVARADHRGGFVTPSEEPTAQAQAIMERVLGLVRECRVVLRALEHPPKTGESSSAEAERILYFTLMSAIDAAHEDDGGCPPVLRHASQPL